MKKLCIASLVFLCSCVRIYVGQQPATAPARAAAVYRTEPEVKRAPPPPMPPMPPATLSRQSPLQTFICIDIRETMKNEEIRDERGIPTQQWRPVKLWIVSLQPVSDDGTNKVFGAVKSQELKLISALPVFTVGARYDLSAQ